MSAIRRGRRIVGRWLRHARRVAADSRGFTLVTAILVIFSLGMMLFGFVFINQNEAAFAVVNRNSTEAVHLADAGSQEALKRFEMFGTGPGSVIAPGVTFTNSEASSTFSPGSTVKYQPTVQGNPWLFPVLSTATFSGAQRYVRIFVRAFTKNGSGTITFGSVVNFSGDASPITGDTYSQTSVLFNQFKKSPLCATGATASNLVAPQVIAGTTIGVQAAGPAVTPPCGLPPTNVTGGFSYECANNSLVEVAPTPCTASGRTANLPVNWHPMVPTGMGSQDFTTVVTATTLPPGMTVVQAAQDGKGLTYTPAGTYTPTYWTSVPTTNGKVMVITAPQPFCVNPTLGTVQPPVGGAGGNCAAGYHYYGSAVGVVGVPTRFVDWGIVSDDLNRTTATLFFQAPAPGCTSPCSMPGRQNGIRYIPLVPPLDVKSLACAQTENPGTNVFDQVNTADGISCTNPPTTTVVGQTTITFSGTKALPEALVIDNAGLSPAQPVTINGSVAGSSTLTCGNVNWDTYNWGVILATADITLAGNQVFSGFIYSQGTINMTGTVLVNGGLFAAAQGPGPTNPAATNQTDSFGTADLCGGTATLPLSPLFFTFTAVSWQDRPANKP